MKEGKNIMKRIISVILTVIMVFSVSGAAFAAGFNDLASDHWAYSYVDTLVSEGTINGFEDGSFRPTATVSRAQFVKMIGMGPTRFTSDFIDVPSSHWAYEYVMTSGLKGDDNGRFNPDVAITRGEVISFLYKRAGSPESGSVPPIIYKQGSDKEAVAWGYLNGIMTGNDNLNLRLGDTLTRAEAAALIIRSRSSADKKTDFINAVDPKVFETVYNAVGAVDKAYDENATLTNGELAMAAARILSREDIPTYPGVSATRSFTHKYSQALNMLCRYYLGEANDNEQYIEKNATVKDAIEALTFAVLRSSTGYIPTYPDGAIYPEITSTSNDDEKRLLANAYGNGIRFDSTDKINAEKDITLKEFACLLLEYDGFGGIFAADKIGFSSNNIGSKIKTDLTIYPKNSADYRVILADVPSNVYETAFVKTTQTPKESYATTNAFKEPFEIMFASLVSAADSKGARINLTYYPGLAVNNGNGYTFRLKLTVESLNGASKLSDIIKCANDAAGAAELKAGESFFIDLDTGKKFDDAYVSPDTAYISQVIK